MAAYGFAPISAGDANKPKLNKDAIDKVFEHFEPRPAYLMLLGSIDVIPHIPLINPLMGLSADPGVDPDPDPDIPSDLPYASNVEYKGATSTVQDFIEPTRVVGRLPNVTGDTDAAYLVALLDTAAAYTPRPTADYSTFLGISADAWKSSTDVSLIEIFGASSALKTSPPSGPNWTAAQRKPLSHFVNCHGRPANPKFYGDPPPGTDVAHEAEFMDGKILEGTVMTAECCYGAELYHPNDSFPPGKIGMCNIYLGNKAYAYFGSSNTSYGHSTTPDRADVICQLFFKYLLSGASAGRACLEARLEYLSGLGHSPTPSDLKTLAQFNVMADPSLTPVSLALLPLVALSRYSASSARAAVEGRARRNRREMLAALSAAVWTYPLGKPRVPRGKVIVAKLQELAEANGIKPPYVMLTYPYGPPPPDVEVPGPPPKAVHIIMKRLPSPQDLPGLVLIRLIEAKEYKEARRGPRIGEPIATGAKSAVSRARLLDEFLRAATTVIMRQPDTWTIGKSLE